MKKKFHTRFVMSLHVCYGYLHEIKLSTVYGRIFILFVMLCFLCLMFYDFIL